MLVGTRQPLLDTLGSAAFEVIDLDQTPYLALEDLVGYVTGRLLLAAEPTAPTPYRDRPQLARRVAAAVAARAYPTFLVAQLVSRALTQDQGPVDVDRPGWADWFPATVADAMDDYLGRFGAEERRARDLLRPLAYAEGDGLARDQLWVALANSLAGRTSYTLDDVAWLLDSAAAYLVSTRPSGDPTAGGEPLYRLYHEALGQHLRPHEEEESYQQRRIVEMLLASITRAGGDRDWEQASGYLRTHLATHAAAGQLDELLADVDYLAVADFTRLLPLLPAEPPTQTAPPVVLLHQAGVRATALPPDRRLSLLALTAAHLGLHDLHRRLVAASPRPVGVRWAHRLGIPHRELTGHTGPVAAVAVGRVGDHDLIVSGSWDGTVRTWDAASRRCETVLDLLGPVTACALDASGLLCVAVGAAVCTFTASPCA